MVAGEEKSGKPIMQVREIGNGEPRQFEVVLRDRGGDFHYQVTMSQTVFERLSGGKATLEECIRAAFRFLLDHEPKESILRRFDISTIERYFPGFFREFPRYRDRS